MATFLEGVVEHTQADLKRRKRALPASELRRRLGPARRGRPFSEALIDEGISLIAEMKRLGVKLIVVEPYFDLKTPQAIANQVGGKVLILAPSVGGEKEATDYIQLFDYDVNLLASTLKQLAAK